MTFSLISDKIVFVTCFLLAVINCIIIKFCVSTILPIPRQVWCSSPHLTPLLSCTTNSTSFRNGRGRQKHFRLKSFQKEEGNDFKAHTFFYYFIVRRWIKIFGYATLGLCFTQPLLPSLSIIIKPFHSGAAFYLLQEEKGLFKGSTLNCIRSSRWSFFTRAISNSAKFIFGQISSPLFEC